MTVYWKEWDHMWEVQMKIMKRFVKSGLPMTK